MTPSEFKDLPYGIGDKVVFLATVEGRSTLDGMINVRVSDKYIGGLLMCIPTSEVVGYVPAPPRPLQVGDPVKYNLERPPRKLPAQFARRWAYENKDARGTIVYLSTSGEQATVEWTKGPRGRDGEATTPALECLERA